MSPGSLPPCGMKPGALNCSQGRARTVAFWDFTEDDMKKLFGCFITRGRLIKLRQSHQEESAVRVKGTREGDDAAIELENLSLERH